MCIVDGGEGANADDDWLGIFLTQGTVWAGYHNIGRVQGNIQDATDDECWEEPA